MFGLVKRLTKAGVLGINRRNAEYVLLLNPRHLYPLVDDKYLTKQLVSEGGIDVPQMYESVEIERQVRELNSLLQARSDFVVKPARGAGGDGILIIVDRMKDCCRKANGVLLTQDEFQHHVSNILSGMYSLGGYADKALIEYRVKFDPVFEAISYQGVPDVRIIVYRGVPVMSMVRLPTRMSDGKANLHQGAIGAGIDITSGQTLTAVWGNDIVSEHPDTGHTVTGVQVPHWGRLLRLASRCYELSGLGYLGVDFVLDKDKGPLLLEMNARPGLNIQIANGVGLVHRLKQVDRNLAVLTGMEERVVFAQQEFPHAA